MYRDWNFIAPRNAKETDETASLGRALNSHDFRWIKHAPFHRAFLDFLHQHFKPKANSARENPKRSNSSPLHRVQLVRLRDRTPCSLMDRVLRTSGIISLWRTCRTRVEENLMRNMLRICSQYCAVIFFYRTTMHRSEHMGPWSGFGKTPSELYSPLWNSNLSITKKYGSRRSACWIATILARPFGRPIVHATIAKNSSSNEEVRFVKGREPDECAL